MIKTSIIFGGSYYLGSWGGNKVADAAKLTSEGARTGTKIGVGVAAFFLLSAIL